MNAISVVGLGSKTTHFAGSILADPRVLVFFGVGLLLLCCAAYLLLRDLDVKEFPQLPHEAPER